MDIKPKVPPYEVERRRINSVAAMQARWQEDYQEKCDRIYWEEGPCCAGCDHWHSDKGLTGQCDANGLIPGADVMRSMGATFSSYTPPPGFPYTNSDFHCGKFKDEFEWDTLSKDYLTRIGYKPKQKAPAD